MNQATETTQRTASWLATGCHELHHIILEPPPHQPCVENGSFYGLEVGTSPNGEVADEVLQWLNSRFN